MPLHPLMLALAGAPRIASGSPEHAIVELQVDGLADDGARPDGWAPRALVSRNDGSVRVVGATREVFIERPQPLAFDEVDALARVTAHGWPGATGATLVITRRGTRAWRVEPPASLAGPSHPVFLVDTQSGEVRVRHDSVVFERVGAFGVNPIVTPRATDFELLDYDATLADGDLRGSGIAVFNCVQPAGDAICGFSTAPPTEPEGDFFHPAPDITVPADNVQLEDFFAVQSVHHHAEVFTAYLDALGVPPLLCNQNDEPIVLVANYKAYIGDETLLIGNAAFIGDCNLTASFGQGPMGDWGYDGEVVYHELAHGVVEAAMGGDFLGFNRPRSDAVVRDAGAINEAMGDFLASALTDDPDHAEYVVQVGGGDERTLDNTLTCPASITGEVHADGELWGGMLWDAHQELGDPFVLAVVDAIGLLQEDATFEEAAAALVSVVTEELGDAAGQTVTGILEGRGLLDCPRVVAWNEVHRPLWLRPRGQAGKFDPLQPPPLQIAVELPEDSGGFVLRFAHDVIPSAGFAPVTELHAIVRYGSPIEFSYDEDADGTVLVDADIDAQLQIIQDAAAADGVTVEAAGGQTVYLGLFNQSPNVTLVSAIDIELLPAVVGEDDSTGAASEASTGDDSGPMGGDGTGSDSGAAQDDAGDGCSCTAAEPRGRGRTSSLWMLLLLLGGVAPRKP